ncbi:hypothetical protein Tco_0458562 [Tanacetum coccineum]
MHNNIMAAGSRDRPPMLAIVTSAHGDHGSYDTLIQDQMVMPYGSAFLKMKYTQLLMPCQTAQEMWEAKKPRKATTRNNLTVATMKVNVQFLQQLQPEWSRFVNPRYLKKAQNEIPCLYAIPHDQSDPANRLVPDREKTQTLEEESRSKLNKDLVKPFDYTKLNSLYEIFKPPTQHYEIQFAQAKK